MFGKNDFALANVDSTIQNRDGESTEIDRAATSMASAKLAWRSTSKEKCGSPQAWNVTSILAEWNPIQQSQSRSWLELQEQPTPFPFRFQGKKVSSSLLHPGHCRETSPANIRRHLHIGSNTRQQSQRTCHHAEVGLLFLRLTWALPSCWMPWCRNEDWVGYHPDNNWYNVSAVVRKLLILVWIFQPSSGQQFPTVSLWGCNFLTPEMRMRSCSLYFQKVPQGVAEHPPVVIAAALAGGCSQLRHLAMLGWRWIPCFDHGTGHCEQFLGP